MVLEVPGLLLVEEPWFKYRKITHFFEVCSFLGRFEVQFQMTNQ